MKKSMLFSTVLMVVLLVVAISTATFAWYTSNTQVNVTDTVINSAESADASIEFVWKNSNSVVYRGTSIAFSSGDAIKPMVPTKNPVADDTSMSFVGATVSTDGETFTAASSGETPWSQNYTSVADADASPDPVTDPYNIPEGVTVNELFIANSATTGAGADLKITATITGDLANALRIAVFFQDSTGTLKYKGTLANSADATNHAGTDGSWSADALVADEISSDGYTATAATTGFTIGNIAPNGEGQLKIFAWYDGSLLGNAQAGKAANFTLQVNVA